MYMHMAMAVELGRRRPRQREWAMGIGEAAGSAHMLMMNRLAPRLVERSHWRTMEAESLTV